MEQQFASLARLLRTRVTETGVDVPALLLLNIPTAS